MGGRSKAQCDRRISFENFDLQHFGGGMAAPGWPLPVLSLDSIRGTKKVHNHPGFN